MALTAEDLDQLVKVEKRDAWPAVKKRWFADETPEQQKAPGFLKEEFQSNDGFFVGLSSKCYLVTAGEKVKRSQKGTPKFLGMTPDQFKRCLFYNEVPQASYHSIMQDKKHGSCVTKRVTKKALNSLYYKHQVADNCVDITPFKTADNKHI